MNRIEKLFERHDSRLHRVASVFHFKSKGTIDTDDFYQEFAIKLLEVSKTYPSVPDSQFIKILNFSLHNHACNLIRERFRYHLVSFDENESEAQVAVPSFLYFYREAVLRLLGNTETRVIFEWLVDNPDVVESIRQERNVLSRRERRMAFMDVMAAVSGQFGLAPYAVRRHLRTIKQSLKLVWAVEYGLP